MVEQSIRRVSVENWGPGVMARRGGTHLHFLRRSLEGLQSAEQILVHLRDRELMGFRRAAQVPSHRCGNDLALFLGDGIIRTHYNAATLGD